MSNYRLLNSINSPADLKALPEEDIPCLAREIRHFLVSNVTKNGGHLASNLGVVELTLALHRVFDSPKDHFIFDVGHQAYVHKMITGRRELFTSLRKPGGLSGFTKRRESEHDPFGAGHSSTSLSAALGFAAADKLNNSDAYTIAIVGDGAYTGGMIHEALNNCTKDMRLIIIINENEMSISRNIGGFAKYIARVRSSKSYYRVKDATRSVLNHIPLVGKAAFSLVRDTKQTIKNMMYDSNYFEELGLYYIGPVDANDYDDIEDMLNVAKHLGRSCVIHVTTKKGKGYRPSEENPAAFHAIHPDGHKPSKYNYSLMVGEYLTELAHSHPEICAITAAMTQGTGLEKFKQFYPNRFFDVGIAEEHATTFAAGLAANGMRPYFAVYSSFLQRAYDNLLHDVALQNLPVTFMVDRAGLSTGDGPTHHGIFDVSFASQIPNVTIISPQTKETLHRAMDYSCSCDGPVMIRYANECENKRVVESFYADGSPDRLSAVRNFTDSDGVKCVIVTYGKVVSEAMKACDVLSEKGIGCGVILLELIKPYDVSAQNILKLLPADAEKVVFLEEGVRNGGASMILCNILQKDPATAGKKLVILAIDDPFTAGETNKTLYQSCGISADDVISAVIGDK
ncbi:MAG: 1-deoxy-D-xylulose-5-phosphate synthase [Clostridia bacterium]|nr:1-deoxy-D-xylulose-5-phosphate synthase [Clostridia bacterium]